MLELQTNKFFHCFHKCTSNLVFCDINLSGKERVHITYMAIML